MNLSQMPNIKKVWPKKENICEHPWHRITKPLLRSCPKCRGIFSYAIELQKKAYNHAIDLCDIDIIADVEKIEEILYPYIGPDLVPKDVNEIAKSISENIEKILKCKYE